MEDIDGNTGQVDASVGSDVGTEEHFAEVLDDAGERLFARSVVNDQTALKAAVWDRAAGYGTPGLVIDQPGSIAQRAGRGPGEERPGRLRARPGDAPRRRARERRGPTSATPTSTLILAGPAANSAPA